jgi:hypothetical protein
LPAANSRNPLCPAQTTTATQAASQQQFLQAGKIFGEKAFDGPPRTASYAPFVFAEVFFEIYN